MVNGNTPPALVLLDEELRRWVVAGLRLARARARQDGMYKIPSSVAELEQALTGDATDGQEPPTFDVSSDSADDGLMSRQAAARFLSISERQLARLTADGRVPSLRLGRRRLYKRADLEELT